MHRLSSQPWPARSSGAAPPATSGSLEGDIAAVLRDRLLEKATVGIHIARLGSAKGEDLYRHSSDVPLMPASNMKVVTTSAALDHFGPEFKLRTLLLSRGADLILIGDGDPTFGDAELLKKSGWTATTIFDNWAKELKKAGLTKFDNVLVDDSIFDEQFVPSRWDPKQLHNRYCARRPG